MSKEKRIFYLVILITSTAFLIICGGALLDLMITYKYTIDQNFDEGNLYYTYEGRKLELDCAMWYLKISIFYLLFMILYFYYKFTSGKKRKDTRQEVTGKYRSEDDNAIE